MNVREAVLTARNFIKELYAEEPIGEVGIEEIQFEDEAEHLEPYDCWRVTIGFVRLWNRLPPDEGPTRVYKDVTINASDGEVIALRDRHLS